jgi:hypothetical protein
LRRFQPLALFNEQHEVGLHPDQQAAFVLSMSA